MNTACPLESVYIAGNQATDGPQHNMIRKEVVRSQPSVNMYRYKYMCADKDLRST